MSGVVFSMIKREKLTRKIYTTRSETHKDIIRYIEHWYNNTWLHSALGYPTPNEKYYQEETTTAQAA